MTTKLLWKCPACGRIEWSEALTQDDRPGVEIAVILDCEDCGDEMKLIDDATKGDK